MGILKNFGDYFIGEIIIETIENNVIADGVEVI